MPNERNRAHDTIVACTLIRLKENPQEHTLETLIKKGDPPAYILSDSQLFYIERGKLTAFSTKNYKDLVELFPNFNEQRRATVNDIQKINDITGLSKVTLDTPLVQAIEGLKQALNYGQNHPKSIVREAADTLVAQLNKILQDFKQGVSYNKTMTPEHFLAQRCSSIISSIENNRTLMLDASHLNQFKGVLNSLAKSTQDNLFKTKPSSMVTQTFKDSLNNLKSEIENVNERFTPGIK